MRPCTLWLLLSMLCLSACAIYGKDIDTASIQQFKVGKTTFDEVQEALGEPSSWSTDSRGYRHLYYTQGLHYIKPESFLPIVGEHVAGTVERTNTHSFSFDHDQVLVDMSFTKKKTSGAGSALTNKVEVEEPL